MGKAQSKSLINSTGLTSMSYVLLLLEEVLV